MIPLFLLFGVRQVSPPAVTPPPVEITLRGDFIASQITKAFQGTMIDLASDRRRNGVLEKGGQLQFGPGLSNQHVEFSVPSDKVSLGWFGDITYRLRDVHLRSLEASADASDFILIARFDGRGPQLVGSHSSLGSSVVPGIYMQDVRVTTRLTPILDITGHLSYTNTRARFVAKISTQGLNFDLAGHHVDLLDSVTGYRDRLASLVAEKIRLTFEDPERKRALTAFLTKALEAQAAKMGSAIKTIRVEGTNLKVTLEPKGNE